MKGGCFCGAVRYELIRPPKEAYYCHCRDCQYLSGSSYHVLGVVERNTLKLLSGELSEYSYVTHDGSGLKRETCKKCGSPLFVTSSSFEDIQMFTVSTLDEPESMKPSLKYGLVARSVGQTFKEKSVVLLTGLLMIRASRRA